jgi:hypothetical protein
MSEYRNFVNMLRRAGIKHDHYIEGEEFDMMKIGNPDTWIVVVITDGPNYVWHFDSVGKLLKAELFG